MMGSWIIELMPGERIIAVVPEPFEEMGYSIEPVVVYIATRDGRLREEFIQSDEQTQQMRLLYNIGATVSKALIAAVPKRRAKRNQSDAAKPEAKRRQSKKPDPNGLLEGEVSGFGEIA
jgi:hypothetical protein